ncbi:hypothetical protein PROFUN_11470 [Planoprotostelium fungivorum]|uniref:Uncharacterized protein n=1 Tax=Planoprotostelium fungivorum TaxID=1890364 RepID=A0A2P6N9W6_9EUKA|nr:hypothetical protein PROFUN_11470 [Planoprotostelium fungivorum]
MKKSSPVQLPPNWDFAFDQNGRIYYIDHVNKRTTYDAPQFVVPQSKTCPKAGACPTASTFATKEQCMSQCTHHAKSSHVSSIPMSSLSVRGNSNQVKFTINGQPHTLTQPDPYTTLNEYIRSVGLTGTKKSCGEGGCGVCTVVVRKKDASTGQTVTASINSCLKPVCTLNGYDVLTTEGLGDKRKGHHDIQKKMAEYNASQCGHCTPGWVMNMYSLLENNQTPTKQQVEDYFDGNLCRCTGYRSILNALESFASDHERPQLTPERMAFSQGVKDIEEITPCGGNKYVHTSHMRCDAMTVSHAVNTSGGGTDYIEATSLQQVMGLLKQYNATKRDYRLVVGNTSTGIFKNERPSVMLDISRLPELAQISERTDSFVFGSTVTITKVLETLEKFGESNAPSHQKEGMKHVTAHLRLIAGSQVRNAGSWAGNMMLAHSRKFPSDLFCVMMGLNAKVTVVTGESEQTIDLPTFMSKDMTGCLLKQLAVPKLNENEQFRSYKQALRHENSHALVNAAFRVKVENSVVSSVSIAYGGVLERTSRASATENYLIGKNMTDPSVVSGAVEVLKREMVPIPTDNHVEQYRASLVLAFFYKFALSLQPSLPSSLNSAVDPFVRPVSTGASTFQPHPDNYPIGEPQTKFDAVLQASGEAKYTDDYPVPANTLYAAIVVSTCASGRLDTVDPSPALAHPGVVRFFSAKDIPAERNYCGPSELKDEEVFATGEILYVGQPIGVVIADSQRHADEAALLVSVTYKDVKTPIMSLDDAIQKNSFQNSGQPPVKFGDVDGALATAAKTFTGSVSCGAQIHFHLEPHAVVCTPDEDGRMKLFGSLQWAKATQKIVATVLDKPLKDVEVSVRRLGGSYGSKISRQIQSFCAVAFASDQLNLPVKMYMNFNTTLETSGRRHPFRADYKVGVDNNNRITALKLQLYADGGSKIGDGSGILWLAQNCVDNCYFIPNVEYAGKIAFTNNPPSTSMRGPGWVPAVYIGEAVMEEIAARLNEDREKFRQKHFYTKGQKTPYNQVLKYWSMDTMWSQILDSSDYSKRQTSIVDYNANNRWTKRGISLSPCKFGLGISKNPQAALIDVMQDATIVISHSGIEMGQGINTKVTQAAAYALKVHVDTIRIVDSGTLTTPNCEATGGSTTSELCVQAVLDGCKTLNQRLQPIMNLMEGPRDWKKLVDKAMSAGIDLQAKGWVYINGDSLGPWSYNSYAVAATEVQLDVLTGNFHVLRTDILYDCGFSLNPTIDIGQVEGAYVQGLGYHTTEKVLYNDRGQLVSNGTWEYKIPSHRDIPIDLRVSLMKDAPNPAGILSSKASGEPPLALGCGVIFALRNAIQAARLDIGVNDFFTLQSPASVDQVQTLCRLDSSQFKPTLKTVGIGAEQISSMAAFHLVSVEHSTIGGQAMLVTALTQPVDKIVRLGEVHVFGTVVSKMPEFGFSLGRHAYSGNDFDDVAVVQDAQTWDLSSYLSTFCCAA